MCDYSLGGLPNRLAMQGEELIVHRFRTHSIGLASPADLEPKAGEASSCDHSLWEQIKNFFAPAFDCPNARAVCVPPGASLIVKGIPPERQRKWNVAEEENVLFVQTSAEVNTYRDAFCFGNGHQVLLQDLSEGMQVRVVSLGGDLVGDSEPAFRRSSPLR
jgi:hypothetical protein